MFFNATRVTPNLLVRTAVMIMSSVVRCCVVWRKFTLQIDAACSFETLVHF
jgi:hypothetical protein